MEQNDAVQDEITRYDTGEHPMVQVVQHQPLPGRRWFAFGWFLFGIALILAVLLVAVPLHDYLNAQHRADTELDCRNGIGNALAAAQATQVSDLSDGLVIAFTDQDSAEVRARLDRDGDYIDMLAALKLEAVSICRDDPTYTPPVPAATP